MQIAKRIATIAAALLIASLPGARDVAARSPQGPRKVQSIPAPEARIDINHASVEELLKVPGMTGSWAGRIVRFRPYYAKNDLLDRGVVSSQVYDRIKNYVIAHRDRQ